MTTLNTTDGANGIRAELERSGVHGLLRCFGQKA